MKHFTAIITVIMLALTATSCRENRDQTDEALRDAEMALAQGDMRAAESMTDHLVGDKNLSGLTPRQLGRLSLIYMQLADSSDHGDQSDHISSATACYRKAYELDKDSAAEFYNQVSPEQTSRVMMLSNIAESLDTPSDTFLQTVDTVPADTIN